MAKVTNPIGIFSGKYGDMIFCNGGSRAPYVRKQVLKINNPRTEAQTAHRSRFGEAAKFLSHFKELIEYCWKGCVKKKPDKYRLASSKLMQEGFDETVSFPKFRFNRISLSSGHLVPVFNPVYQLSDCEVSITWDVSNSYVLLENPDDEVILALYNEDLAYGTYIKAAGERRQGLISLKLNPGLANSHTHLWLILRSKDGKHASKSIYLGTGN